MQLVSKSITRPSKEFWDTEKRAFISGEQEQRPNFEGNRGTKTNLGNREHKKTNFRFLGNRETGQFISGEQGNRYPLWEGLYNRPIFELLITSQS